jgi:hypothetical protein
MPQRPARSFIRPGEPDEEEERKEPQQRTGVRSLLGLGEGSPIPLPGESIREAPERDRSIIDRVLEVPDLSGRETPRLQRFMDLGALVNPTFAANKVLETLGLSTPMVSNEKLTGIGMATGESLISGMAGLMALDGDIARRLGIIGEDEDLPITDHLAQNLRQGRNYIRGAREDMLRFHGVSESAIDNIEMAGDVLGLFVPGLGALKLASYLRGSRRIMTVDYVQDALGGAIYGFGITDGAIEERASAAVTEALAWPIFTIAMRGAISPMLTFRMNRSIAGADRTYVKGLISDLSHSGKITAIPRERAAEFGRLKHEENLISTSPEAQNILIRSADETALVQGIIDLKDTGSSMGFLRGVRNAEELIPQMRERFPGIKFSAVRTDHATRILHRSDAPNAKDIYFGTRDLTPKEMSQFARTGIIPGQEMLFGGSKVKIERIGDVLEDGNFNVWVRHLDGGDTRKVSIADLQEVSGGILPHTRFAKEDALFDDFFDFANSRMQSLKESGGSRLTSTELRNAVREGRIDLDAPTERMMLEPFAITHAADVPYVPRPEPPISNNELAILYGNEYTRLLSPHSQFSFDDLFAAWARERGFLRPRNEARSVGPAIVDTEGALRAFDAGDEVISRGRFYARNPELPPQYQVRWHDEVPVERARLVSEDVTDLTVSTPTTRGQPRQYASGTYPPAEEIARVQNISPANDVPLEVTRLDRRTLDPQDLMSARDHFAERFSRRLMEQIDPEEVARFRTLQREMEDTRLANPDDFRAKASDQGYHAYLDMEGNWTLSDINTGGMMKFESKEAMLETLDKGARRFATGEVSSILPPGFATASRYPGGVYYPSSTPFFPDDTLTNAVNADIGTTTISNLRDFFMRVENAHGVPMWSRIFEPLTTANAHRVREMEPFLKEFDRIWRPVKRKEAIQIAEFWTDVEYQQLSTAARNRMMKERGFSPKMIKAENEAREAWFAMGRFYGVEAERMIPNYFGRIRKWSDSHGGQAPTDEAVLRSLFGDELPKDVQVSMKFARTGELDTIEMDPRLVMSGQLRAFTFEKYMSQVYEDAVQVVGSRQRNILGMRFSDLSPEDQSRLLANAEPERAQLFIENPNTPLLPEPLRDIAKEYLSLVRGIPASNFKRVAGTLRRGMEKIGVELPESVVRDYVNTALSLQYGAALGARVSMLSRNLTQLMFMLYTRLGPRHGGEAFTKALTDINAFKETVEAGGIRSPLGRTTGVPFHDEQIIGSMDALRGDGILGTAVAGVLRAGLRTGQVGRQLSETMLIPYSSTDDLNRVVAYHWQKLHTDDWLRRFEAGDITREKFAEEGLSFFSPSIRNQFFERYNALGREDALRFIARQSSDEANFIYGSSAQPLWMQNPFGRLFGVFGTWPIWLKELYAERTKHATTKQNALLGIRTATASLGIALPFAAAGIEFWNWIAPTSLFKYAGGPWSGILVDTKALIESPLDQKGAALVSLSRNVTSLIVPGQVAFRDASLALTGTESPLEALLMYAIGRPSRGEDNYAFDYLYTSDEPMRVDLSPMQRARWLDPDGDWNRGMTPELRAQNELMIASSALAAMMQRGEIDSEGMQMGGSMRGIPPNVAAQDLERTRAMQQQALETGQEGGTPTGPPPELMEAIFGPGQRTPQTLRLRDILNRP